MPNDLNRKLYSAKHSCSSGCLYCFASWSGYEKQDTFSLDLLNDEYDIICPNCDGEFFNESGKTRNNNHIY